MEDFSKSLFVGPAFIKDILKRTFICGFITSFTRRTIQRCFNRHSLIFLFKHLFSPFLQTNQSNAALLFFVNVICLYYCCRPFPSVCQRKVKVLFLSFLALPKHLLQLSESECRHSSVCQCPLCYWCDVGEERPVCKLTTWGVEVTNHQCQGITHSVTRSVVVSASLPNPCSTSLT